MRLTVLLERARESHRRAVERRPPFEQISGLRLLDNLDNAICRLNPLAIRRRLQ